MNMQLPLGELQKKLKGVVGKYKFVLLIILAGVLLLLLPIGDGKGKTTASGASVTEEDFSVVALEEKLEKTLAKISGAGKVTVMLTVQGGSRRVLAEDESQEKDQQGSQSSRTTVVVSGGSGNAQDAVLVQQLYPKFQGALVVSSGGGEATVRLKLMEAVSAVTGLGANKISICKGKD